MFMHVPFDFKQVLFLICVLLHMRCFATYMYVLFYYICVVLPSCHWFNTVSQQMNSLCARFVALCML